MTTRPTRDPNARITGLYLTLHQFYSEFIDFDIYLPDAPGMTTGEYLLRLTFDTVRRTVTLMDDVRFSRSPCDDFEDTKPTAARLAVLAKLLYRERHALYAQLANAVCNLPVTERNKAIGMMPSFVDVENILRQWHAFAIDPHALDALLNNINWSLLREQKQQLLHSIDLFDLPSQGEASRVARDHLVGIVHLIDALQDCAVQTGMPEDKVFGAL